MEIPSNLPRGFHELVASAAQLDHVELCERILEHYEEVDQAGDDLPLDVPLARQLAYVSFRLLEQAVRLPAVERDLALAAVAYFIENDDEVPDLESPEGLLDDLEVMNWVVGRLGMSEWLIPING